VQEVVVSFHKAPKRWWEACTSKKGKANLFRQGRAARVCLLSICRCGVCGAALQLLLQCSFNAQCGFSAHPQPLAWLCDPPCRAIDGLATGKGTVPRKGAGYAMTGVHVNRETLALMAPKRTLDSRLSHTERLMQNTQNMVKETEAGKGEWGVLGGGAVRMLHCLGKKEAAVTCAGWELCLVSIFAASPPAVRLPACAVEFRSS
jgi:hypothetical protein